MNESKFLTKLNFNGPDNSFLLINEPSYVDEHFRQILDEIDLKMIKIPDFNV